MSDGCGGYSDCKTYAETTVCTLYSIVSLESQTPCCSGMSGSSCSVTIIVGHLHTVQRLFRAHSNKLQVKAYSSGAATLAVGTKQSFQKPLLFSLFHVEEITPTGVIKSLTNGFRFAHWSLPPFVNLMSKSRSLQSRGSVQRYIVPCTLLSAYLAYIIPLIYRLSIVFFNFFKSFLCYFYAQFAQEIASFHSESTCYNPL